MSQKSKKFFNTGQLTEKYKNDKIKEFKSWKKLNHWPEPYLGVTKSAYFLEPTSASNFVYYNF
jgi:hypothetical protein